MTLRADNQHQEVNIEVISKVLSEVDDAVQHKIKCNRNILVCLADEMAESATTFRGQGYSVFLKSRDKFVEALDTMNKEYQDLLKLIRK